MLFQQFRKPRLILALVVFLSVVLLLWLVRGALFPFLLGLVIAYLITPLVNRLQGWMPNALKRRYLARPAAILVVYLLGIGLAAGVLAFLVPLIVDQVVSLSRAMPGLYDRGREWVEAALAQYQSRIPAETQAMIEEGARNLAGSVLRTLRDGALATFSAVSGTISWLLGLIVVPFWLFFILNEEGRATSGALSIIPSDLRSDVESMRIIVDRVLSAYIRGQLLLGLAVGVISFIGLLTLGVQFSLLLAIIAGILELVPYIGPILGAIPAVIVAFLQDPQLALWVIVLFVIIQQVENVLLVPKITGESVALHPAIIMVALVVGNALAGIVGMLVVVPLTAILRDVVHYLYIRAGEGEVEPLLALRAVGYADRATPLLLAAATPAARAQLHPPLEEEEATPEAA